MTGGRRRHLLGRPRTVGGLVGLAAGLVALGPSLGPGYLLFYDMVFVPRLALSPRTLGVDGSVPRAVPNDLLVALLSQVAPGWVVQKALLLLVFVAAGAGVGGLLRTRSAAAAGALVAAWNPWVAQRLAIGHWGFLLGYAALPWVAQAAGRARSGDPRGRAGLAVALLAASLTGSTGAVLASILTVCVLLVPSPRFPGAGRTWAVAAATLVLANAAWWYPFLVLAPSSTADPAGVTAFASRADTPLGLLGSVLTGGGIWNEHTWFAERATWPVSLLALVAVVAVLATFVLRRGWQTHPAGPGVVAAGVVGLVLGLLSALPGGRALVEAVVVGVPGGGLLRDSQKLLGLWVLVVAVAGGYAVQLLLRALPARGASRAGAALLASVVALWPVVTLPGLAWGGGGRWAAVDYPRGDVALAARLDAAEPGAVAVFPWSLYRRSAWNGERVVLDPWQRLVGRRVLVSDDLPLSGTRVRGESADAATVLAANAAGRPLAPVLRAVGVRWVVVLTDQPSARLPAPDLSGGEVVATAPGLRLLDLGPVDPAAAERLETQQAMSEGVLRYSGLALAVLALLGVLGYSWVTFRKPRGPDS